MKRMPLNSPNIATARDFKIATDKGIAFMYSGHEVGY